MLVPGMRVCLVVGSHVAALGFRRREECGCHDLRVLVCVYRTANVRIVMGGAGSREVQAGGARSMGSLYI